MWSRSKASTFGMHAMVESTKSEGNITWMDTTKPPKRCTSSMVVIGMGALTVFNPKLNIQKKERPCLSYTKRPKQ